MPQPVLYQSPGWVSGVSWGPSFIPQTGNGSPYGAMRGIGARVDGAYQFAKIPGTSLDVGKFDLLAVGVGAIAGAFFGKKGALAATATAVLSDLVAGGGSLKHLSTLKYVAEVGAGGFIGTKLGPQVQRQLKAY